MHRAAGRYRYLFAKIGQKTAVVADRVHGTAITLLHGLKFRPVFENEPFYRPSRGESRTPEVSATAPRPRVVRGARAPPKLWGANARSNAAAPIVIRAVDIAT